MTEKQIETAQRTLPNYCGCWHDMTDEQKQLDRELSCRGMINTIMIYHCKPGEQKQWSTELKATVTAEEYIFNDKYLKDYIEPGRGCYSEQRYIGAERVKELISEQWHDFQQCKVGYAGEGYNYCFWPDDELYNNNKYQ